MESGRYESKTNCWVCKTWDEEERKAWQGEEGRKKGEIQKGREERRKERCEIAGERKGGRKATLRTGWKKFDIFQDLWILIQQGTNYYELKWKK